MLAGGEAGRRMLLSPQQARQAATGVWREVAPDSTAAARPALLGLIMQAWELCRQYEISSRELADAAGSVDQTFFADWARRFYAHCTERDWLDPASAASAVAADLDAGLLRPAGRLYVAGFTDPAPQLQKLLSSLEDCGVLAGRIAPSRCGTVAERLDCATPDEEYRQAAAWAREQLERDRDALIGIVVPELAQCAARIRRHVLDAFDPDWRGRDGAEFPVHIDSGRALTDCGLVHSALLILRLAAGPLDFRDFGQLLRSPYLEGHAEEAGARAGLDVRLRERRLQRIDPVTRAWRDQVPVFAGNLERLLSAGPLTHERREPAEWLGVFETLLEHMGWNRGRAAGHDEDRQLQAWNNGLQDFARCGVVVGRIGFRRARQMLEETLQSLSVERMSSGGGVQILAPREAIDLEFDQLWVCGLTSAAWPPAPRPNPLVPAVLQRERGVTEADPDRFRDQSLQVFARLVDASQSAVASWPARDDDEPRVPSPVLDACAPRDETPLTDDYRQQIHASAAIETRDDPAPPLDPREKALGGSQLLTLQSSCPARAFFELRLGARELSSPPFAIDARWRGTLTHKAAERLYRALGADGPHGAEQGALDEAVQNAIAATLDAHVPDRHPLAATLRRNERVRLERLLRDLVAQDRARPPFTIADLEEDRQVTIGPLQLGLRLDRVDRLADQRTVVFDYKTGREKNLSVWRGTRPEDPQLPLYAATGNADGIGFIWISGADIKVAGLGAADLGVPGLAGTRDLQPEDWPQIVADWQATLAALAHEFAAGDCRINPDNDRYARGDFAMLTRRFELRWTEATE